MHAVAQARSAESDQRHADKFAALTLSYEERLRKRSAALSEAVLRVARDGALPALARDPQSEQFLAARLDELLQAAVRDEREAALTMALQKQAELEANCAQLRRLADEQASQLKKHSAAIQPSSSDAASFESAHRSSLALTQATAAQNRAESQLRDAIRDSQVHAASATVLQDQLAKVQAHATAQTTRLAALQRELEQAQLAANNAGEQAALAREHAREAELNAQLEQHSMRRKQERREAELAAEISALRAELEGVSTHSQRNLENELNNLKTEASHDSLIALHKLRQESQQESEERIRRIEADYRTKVEQLEEQVRTLQRSAADEAARTATILAAERQSLLDSQRAEADRAARNHTEALEKERTTAAADAAAASAELRSMRERLNGMLDVQARVEDKSAGQHRATSSAALNDRQSESRIRDLDLERARLESTNRSLLDQLSVLKDKLSQATAAQLKQERAAVTQAEEWRQLTIRYNDAVQQLQAISSGAASHSSVLTQVTHERDRIRARYIELGNQLEATIATVERQVAASAEEERSKRDTLKARYAEERAAWKNEKYALLETVSLQEKKLLETTALLQTAQEKTEEQLRHSEHSKVQLEKERHAAAATIAQLQQDVQTLQSHRKEVERDLAAKIHHIEKLMLERTHVADFAKSATDNLQMAKESSVVQMQHEFNLRTEENKHALEQAQQAFELREHQLRMEHEAAKTQLWKEANEQLESKLAQVRSTMWTQEVAELEIRTRVEARIAGISKDLIPPHQHEAIVESKLAAERAKLALEAQRDQQHLQTQHNAKLAELEQRHNLKLEEARLKSDSEYTAYAERMRSGLQELEDRLQKERQATDAALKDRDRVQDQLRSLESQQRELHSRLDTCAVNEQRFLSHISSQSTVIEKLKSLLDSEKVRAQDMPAAERNKLEARIDEEMQRRDAREREHRQREDKLLADHRAQLGAVEQQQKSLWVSREKNWLQEQSQREATLAANVANFEASYKQEMQKRDLQIRQANAELTAHRERTIELEDELEALQGQLRQTAVVLEEQTAKMTRFGAQISPIKDRSFLSM